MRSHPLNLSSAMASRPHITTILAMSADGKISDAHHTAARFPSTADQQHLERCLATVDATLFGAGTLRAYGTTALVKDPDLLDKRRQHGQPPQPLHIVCSGSGQLDPTARFFSQPIMRWLLTTGHGAANWQGTDYFERVWIAPTGQSTSQPAGHSINAKAPANQPFDWPAIVTELKTLGIDRLVAMGGGHLIADLMAVDLIDELWLTVCPLIIGGDASPTPCDGQGFSLGQAPRFKLISNQTIGDEVFLNYRRQR